MEAMKEITIEVSPEIADAYQSASPQKRKKIQAIVSILLQKQADRDIALLRELTLSVPVKLRRNGDIPACCAAVNIKQRTA